MEKLIICSRILYDYRLSEKLNENHKQKLLINELYNKIKCLEKKLESNENEEEEEDGLVNDNDSLYFNEFGPFFI